MPQPKQITNNSELPAAILDAVQHNHIWCNSFLLVNPSQETFAKIGEVVVRMWRERDNTLPNYYGPTMEGAPITEIQKLTPVLYLSFNAS